MNSFKFNIWDLVKVSENRESGKTFGQSWKIIGRAEYGHGENQYCVEYLSVTGRMVKFWRLESALEEVEVSK